MDESCVPCLTCVSDQRRFSRCPMYRDFQYVGYTSNNKSASSGRADLALRERELAAKAYSAHPALMRLQELETMRELARTATARLYIGFDKHFPLNSHEEKD
jgi:hypothetical protein